MLLRRVSSLSCQPTPSPRCLQASSQMQSLLKGVALGLAKCRAEGGMLARPRRVPGKGSFPPSRRAWLRSRLDPRGLLGPPGSAGCLLAPSPSLTPGSPLRAPDGAGSTLARMPAPRRALHHVAGRGFSAMANSEALTEGFDFPEPAPLCSCGSFTC